MRFGRKGKLSPRYIGPYRVIRKVGQVAYELDLPSKLESVHPVFHVSMLRKCIGDPYRIVLVDDVQVTEQLSYEETPIAILDRQIWRLRTKDVASSKSCLRIMVVVPPSVLGSKSLSLHGSLFGWLCFGLERRNAPSSDLAILVYVEVGLEDP
ncbi:PREDICTED: uncharacterized protein LOC109227774 [Nicotiana attenuata]|uniref:uncharacterized protein LOC109227774 n=1 Tax=Nicotiana attenuata TaxID=49451 RepID=UPI0009052134|nr:PREDICTED: uncharacterized protein LOC109227774 [Nicotiana attenuata]